MNEKEVEALNNSRVARIILTNLKPRLEKKKSAILASLKIAARESKSDPVVYVAGLQAICALDDIEAEITREVNSGQQLEKEIFAHGSNTTTK